jgi:hypothetical protein
MRQWHTTTNEILPRPLGEGLGVRDYFRKCPYDKGDELYRSNLSDARMQGDTTNYSDELHRLCHTLSE